jgi:ectoine hydroxylase-related dioxygenase (phytanoyl-CoA dioxygenase family)
MHRTREPHPWNGGFEWALPDRLPTTITPEQRDQFDRDGFFVLRGAVDPETIAAIEPACAEGVAMVAGLLEQSGGRFSVAGLDTQIVAPHLVLRSEALRRFCRHPILTGTCRDLMGDDVRLYWEQAVYKATHGAEPVLWHQDNGYTFIEPQAYLTFWVSLTDATVANGCVSIMAGAHRDGTLTHAETPIGFECWGDHDSAVDVPTNAGDVVVFSSLSPHATRINTTDAVRKAYIVQYCHADAMGYLGDGSGGRGDPRPQADPDRQFPVVSGGAVVAPD